MKEKYLIDTIYFGGGTPSLADPGLIKDMLSEVCKYFDIAEGAEISMEANPGTVSKKKLQGFRDAGVDRLSIGLQSFDDEILKSVGRIHTSNGFIRTYDDARAAGFENINVDLIFAIPGMSTGSWASTLEKTVEIKPEHVSFYSLQIEEGTPLYEDYKAGLLDEVTDEDDRRMYHMCLDTLREAGYIQYEISNAALPGYECRHNLKYWRFQDYLGLGASASSFVDGVRSTNVADGYEKAVNDAFDGEGKELPKDLFSEYHRNTERDDMSEYMFTGLRLSEGIGLEDFRARFGMDAYDAFPDAEQGLRPFFEEGCVKKDAGRLFLTEKGMDISNKIMCLFV